jgi:hypothetical protein
MPVGLSPKWLAYETVNCSEYHPLTPTRQRNSDSQNPPGEGGQSQYWPAGNFLWVRTLRRYRLTAPFDAPVVPAICVRHYGEIHHSILS